MEKVTQVCKLCRDWDGPDAYDYGTCTCKYSPVYGCRVVSYHICNKRDYMVKFALCKGQIENDEIIIMDGEKTACCMTSDSVIYKDRTSDWLTSHIQDWDEKLMKYTVPLVVREMNAEIIEEIKKTTAILDGQVYYMDINGLQVYYILSSETVIYKANTEEYIIMSKKYRYDPYGSKLNIYNVMANILGKDNSLSTLLYVYSCKYMDMENNMTHRQCIEMSNLLKNILGEESCNKLIDGIYKEFM